jgi:mannose-6-phosphate isomerase-like protein (cupin superfamily)
MIYPLEHMYSQMEPHGIDCPSAAGAFCRAIPAQGALGAASRIVIPEYPSLSSHLGKAFMAQDSQLMLTTKSLPGHYDYLAPDGSEIRSLLEVDGGGLAHCQLPPSSSSKAVKHQTVEEIWYFLSGTGQVWRKLMDEEIVNDVSPGVSLTIPKGASFQFRTTSEACHSRKCHRIHST